MDVQQRQIAFKEQVLLEVQDFNLQEKQFFIASKADTIAQRRYEVTKQRFLIDKVDVLELEDAARARDVSRKSFIGTLRQYWLSYFKVRRTTLFDFKEGEKLGVDFDKLVE